MNLLDSALKYLSHGYSVIPIGTNKKPLIPWKEYQSRRPAKEEIEAWFRDLSPVAIGIITGGISGVAVLDIDVGAQTGGLIFPPTPTVKTGGGGSHYYYKYPRDKTIQSRNGFQQKMDFKAEGGYVIAPPSLHASGNRYEWVISLEDRDMAEAPEWILGEISAKGLRRKAVGGIIGGVPDGKRNGSAAVIAGKFLAAFKPEEWESIGWPSLMGWNQKNQPPSDEKELRGVWDSIKAREEQKRNGRAGGGGESQSDRLISMLEDEERGIIFFHDENANAYVNFPIGNHRETWPCKNRIFRNWLTEMFWQAEEKSPNSEALTSAISFAESKARFAGEQIQLSVRVAWHDGALWYDLADRDWQTVKIMPDGWEVIVSPPIIFKRYAHQQPQAVPLKSELHIKEFLQFVNVTDHNQQLLLLVLLITNFIPDFPHPAPLIHGAQGSAKSMLLKFMRKLIDPSSIELIGFPRNQNELAQVLQHNWCVFFDNISYLQDWMSDMLCRAISGDGFSKRELYSDDDDIIYSFRRCIGINGILPVVTKSDLLERSIVFGINQIPKDRREQERILLEKFEKQRPYLLGSIFNAVSCAMRIHSSMKVDSLPRMADFTVWGCAIAEALGYGKERFLEAYLDNINNENTEILSESLVASVLLVLMGQREEWRGNASSLLKELTVEAQKQNIDTAQEKEWPKAANVLTKKLKQLETNLAAAGLKITRGRDRLMTIRKVPQPIVSTVPASQMAYILPSHDDTSESQSYQSSSHENVFNRADGDGRDDGDDLLRDVSDDLP